MENLLKDLRNQAGWTQAELGEKLSVSRQTVVAIEKGKYDPSLPLAFQMAQLFNLKIEELFLYRDADNM